MLKNLDFRYSNLGYTETPQIWTSWGWSLLKFQFVWINRKIYWKDKGQLVWSQASEVNGIDWQKMARCGMTAYLSYLLWYHLFLIIVGQNHTWMCFFLFDYLAIVIKQEGHIATGTRKNIWIVRLGTAEHNIKKRT